MNGYDALELSMVNAYDLILLDQSMPGMDGIEILTKLKEQNKSYVNCDYKDRGRMADERGYN